MNADRLSRAFAVVRLIAESPDALSLSEVSRLLGAPVSSTHDLLRRLTELRLVDNLDGRYAVGPEAIAMSARVLDGISVHVAARRHLIDLAEETGEAVYLAVPSGDRIIYVDRFLGTSRLSIHIRLGEPLYLHCTSVGKLFAALDARFRRRALTEVRPSLTPLTIVDAGDLERELERIAGSGCSITRGESFLGILGIAIPVWGADGSLAGAIHLSTSEASVDDARLADLTAAMKRTADVVMAGIGGWVPSSHDEARAPVIEP